LKEVIIPYHAWYEDEGHTITFPEEWDILYCNMMCEETSGLPSEAIEASIKNPIGQRPLDVLAAGAEEVAIIFDDMTRPTKTYQYAPLILEILEGAGVPRDNIRFIIGAGSHGTYGRRDFVKKLGEETVDNYQVYNHNPYEMLDYLGETSFGCPIYVNGEVMSCDLKIGIGTVLFHRLTGFSGGGKIISPGVAGIETIRYNHGELGGFGPDLTPHPSSGYLKNEGNVLRLDAEEAAGMAGLDFKVDTVLNLRRDPLEVFAGDYVETQRRAAEGAKRWHRTECKEADIVVVGSYMRENEPYLGFFGAYQMVKSEGSIVLFYSDPDGDINHWIFGRHGKKTGASLWSSKPSSLRKGARLIIYSPFKLKSFELRFQPEETTWCKTWEEVLEELGNVHGEGSRVAVIPDGTSCIPEGVLED
jgi:nickel-dependent lactate racemase